MKKNKLLNNKRFTPPPSFFLAILKLGSLCRKKMTLEQNLTSRKNLVGGFTLAEMLMGIMIFMISFVAVSKLEASSLRDITQTKKLLTAKYLATEGLEYVKNIKESYQTQAKTFTEFKNNMADPCNGSNQYGCDILYDRSYFDEATINSFANVSNILYQEPLLQPQQMYFAQNAGTIGHSNMTWNPTGINSPYARRIIFSDISSASPLSYAYKVTSTVYFLTDNGTENKVEMSEIIHFNQ